MCVSEIIEKEKKQEQKGGVTHVKWHIIWN
jgi:hypothetical protein